MSEETKIQPGQWWEKPGTRVFVVGLSLDGRIVAEREYGTIALLAKGALYQDGWKQLEGCTGWDWQPEVYPQYIISKPPSVFADGGFLIRHSAEQAAHVQASGCILPFEWSAFFDGMLRDGYWIAVTRAEAEATIAEPEPPTESPDDWVTQDRVPARPGIDQAWWQYDHYDENIKKAFWTVFGGSFASSRKHGYRDNTSACTLQVRCRRKDLPPMPMPEPPGELPDDWVTQDRVPARPGIDQYRYVFNAGIIGGWWSINGAGTRRHGDIDRSGNRVEVRCRRKDLPPLPQQPTAPEPAKTRTVTLQEWVCIYGEEIILRWQAGKPEGWDHEYPTGNTRTIEVPCE